ncbi:MAG: hypothetical protein ACUVQ1_08430 [Candidatus Kapaibacteriales bacterium]
MKRIALVRKKILPPLLLFLALIEVKAQINLVNVYIDSIELVKPYRLEFSLLLERTSDNWEYWANGTFQIAFDSAGYLPSPDKHTIEYIKGSSDLNVIPIPGILPNVSYIITPNVWPGRFSITIAGPEEYENCIVPRLGNFIKIGRFAIESKDKSIVLPQRLTWLKPYIYYQACAFKLDQDSIFIPNLYLASTNDNFEMDDGLNSFVTYSILDRPSPRTVLKYFDVEYVGLKQLDLKWETISEYLVKGFIVVRGLRTGNNSSPTDVDFKDTIADFRKPGQRNFSLLGQGTSFEGKEYSFQYDTVEYRGLEYCYKLLYQDFYDNLITLAYDCERIPNSIITKATPSPNPFSNSTTIEYIVEDDVILDAFVNDLTGRILVRLINHQYTSKGKHWVDFLADPNAQEGLYNVVFIAYPIDDPTVELSRAIVKLQLIR